MICRRRQWHPLQYSCLEHPMGGGAWWAAVHGVAKSQTRLSSFTFTFHFHALEKEMATHSSVLAWRIPGMGKPGGLPSVGSHRVRHDWSDLAAAAVHDLYTENYKTLLRESIMPLINKDAMFTDQKTQYFYNIKSLPIDLWIRYNPYQNTSRTFYFTSWL